MGNVQDAPLMADVCVKFVGSERVQRSRWKLADAISFCDLMTDQIRHKHRIEFIWIENTDGELFYGTDWVAHRRLRQ